MRFPRPLAATLLALVALSGCTELQGPCPYVRVPPSLAQVTKFAPGGSQDPANVVYQARIADVAMQCTYIEAKYAAAVRSPSGRDQMEVLFKVKIAAIRGPKAPPDGAEARFFVAVTDLRDIILDRQEFPVRLKLAQGNQVATTEEEAWMLFNLDGRTGAVFRIYTGFELSAAELEFNRRRTAN